MKPIVLTLLVIFLVCAAESASHHRRHRASTVKPDPEPIPEDDDDGGDDEGSVDWPAPATIENFGVPDGFVDGGGDGEVIPGRRRAKSSHKSRSN